MPSTTVTRAVEPTAEQTTLIADLEKRARAALAEVKDIINAVVELEKAGLRTVQTVDGVDQIESLVEDTLILRVAGGRRDFSEWFSQRVCLQCRIDEIVEGEDDLPHVRRVIQIEEAMRAANPHLMEALETISRKKSHQLRFGGESGIDEVYKKIGMSEDELRQRLGDALSALIESGWRP